MVEYYKTFTDSLIMDHTANILVFFCHIIDLLLKSTKIIK